MIMGIYVSHTAGSTAVPIPVPYHFMKPHYALHPSLSLLPMPTSSGGAASIRTLLTKVKEGFALPHSPLWLQHSSFFQTKHQQGTAVHIGPQKKINTGDGILRARRTFPGKQAPGNRSQTHFVIRLYSIEKQRDLNSSPVNLCIHTDPPSNVKIIF